MSSGLPRLSSVNQAIPAGKIAHGSDIEDTRPKPKPCSRRKQHPRRCSPVSAKPSSARGKGSTWQRLAWACARGENRARASIRTSDQAHSDASSKRSNLWPLPHEQVGAEQLNVNLASTTKALRGGDLSATPASFSFGCAGAQRGLNPAISLKFERRLATAQRQRRRQIAA